MLGAAVVTVILVAMAALIYARSRRAPVDAGNVNDDWDVPAQTEQRAVTAA